MIDKRRNMRKQGRKEGGRDKRNVEEDRDPQRERHSQTHRAKQQEHHHHHHHHHQHQQQQQQQHNQTLCRSRNCASLMRRRRSCGRLTRKRGSRWRGARFASSTEVTISRSRTRSGEESTSGDYMNESKPTNFEKKKKKRERERERQRGTRRGCG